MNRNQINKNTIISDLEITNYNINNQIPDEYRVNALKLLDLLKRIVDKWGCPIYFSSAFRGEKLNKIVGGHRNSYHLQASAIDLVVLLEDQDRFMNMLKDNFYDEIDFAQNYIYKIKKGRKIPRNFVHLNISDNPRHIFNTEIVKGKNIIYGKMGKSIDLIKE